MKWIDSSDNETGFRIERRLSGNAEWTQLGTVGADSQSFSDDTVDLGITYDYRAFAVGLAGESPPSNTATATAPGAPVDTEPPVVAIMSPGDGDQVSGNVQITVQATDNVGVALVDIDTRVDGSDRRLCRVIEPTTAEVTCSWNTRKIEPGFYSINVYANDARGNFTRTAVSVEVVTRKKGGGKNK